jgi:DNA topoisomerase-1
MQDQARRGLPREKVLATLVRLLEVTLMRVGNREYARANNSYGLTTFARPPCRLRRRQAGFEYRGKGGKLHRISLRDRRLARVVRSRQELPGQHLFQYLDDSGERQAVDSVDVNAYLEEIAGQPFTARDFRTWAGTVLASLALSEFESFDTEAAAKRNVTHAIEQVAAQLGNTTAVCRKSYVHPEIVNCYLDGSLLGFLKGWTAEARCEDLADLREEAAVLALLQHRLNGELNTPTGKGNGPLAVRELKAALHLSIQKENGAAQVPATPSSGSR